MWLAALLFLHSAVVHSAVVTAEPDWAQHLRDDATAFRDAVLDSHPGPKDRENPGFLPLLQAAHARALERARVATSVVHYAWGLREFAAAMNDGHLGIDAEDKILDKVVRSYRWPGFATALRGAKHVVIVTEQTGGPPVGATLESCDGANADALAEQRIGRFVGRWMLRSRREVQSGQLFLPSDNPYLASLRRCTFTSPEGRKTIDLAWRPITAGRRKELLAAAVGVRHHSPVGLERFEDGIVWLNLGSFESDPNSPVGQTLVNLTAQVEREAASIRKSRRIVFDLRGNNGGSTAWTSMIATSLWGQRPVTRATPSTKVDWRVSDANLKKVQDVLARFSKSRADTPDSYAWAVKVEAGLREAHRQGAALWREDPTPRPAAATSTFAVGARVFVLTDFNCASACLDAVDLLTGLGAVHVGQETAADTQYMDTRVQTIGDRAVCWLPMKVYRGRKRGANVPSVPSHAWTGDMRDTAGLRSWIAGL